MKNPLTVVACVLALSLPTASCFTVDHFTGNAERFDGLYFGSEEEAPLYPKVADSTWRNYAVFGLVSWDERKEQFAGDRLAEVEGEKRPLKFIVTSEQTFVNGLAGYGVSLILGPFGPLLFWPRSIEVAGWS